METFIIFWFGLIVGLSAIVLLYRKRIDTLESEIDTKINLQEGKKKAEAFYSRHETFPEYLERVGAIKSKAEPKSYHENQLERYNQIIKDRPKPNFEYVPQNRTKADEANYYRKIQHMDEKDILDKFDIDIAKTCEEADKSYGEYYAGGFGWMKIPNNIVNGDNKPIEQTNKNSSLHKESFCQVVARVKSDMNNPSKQDNLTVRILKKFDTPEKQFQLLYDVSHIENHETFPIDKNGNGGC